MKNRLAVFLMPRAGEAGELLHQGFGFANHHPGKDAGAETLEEFFVAANVPAVQKRNVEFDVVAVKFPAFGEGPRGGAYAKMQVPERLAQRGDGLLAEKFLVAFLSIEKQEIDVRIRK